MWPAGDFGVGGVHSVTMGTFRDFRAHVHTWDPGGYWNHAMCTKPVNYTLVRTTDV